VRDVVVDAVVAPEDASAGEGAGTPIPVSITASESTATLINRPPRRVQASATNRVFISSPSTWTGRLARQLSRPTPGRIGRTPARIRRASG